MRHARTSIGRVAFARALRSAVIGMSALSICLAGEPDEPLRTISLTLRTRAGGEIDGAMLDHDERGIVLLRDATPFAFAWIELEGGSAVSARRDLMNLSLGEGNWRATDHFELGEFALRVGRNDLAAREFNDAKRLDPTLSARIAEAFDRFRMSNEADRSDRSFPGERPNAQPPSDSDPTPVPDRGETTDLGAIVPSFVEEPPDEIRRLVREAYLRFGETVRERLGRDITLIESDHFLIWTDWERSERGRLVEWAESMYKALCLRFGTDPDRDVFLARCPVFCFQTRARFRKFAREFDGYDGANAIGYTRSIAKNGHVHMVFARGGRSPADYDRFACTLVHEGVHAFLHRFHGGTLIPHWVNEGYADMVASRVLGERCPNADAAALLARQYARFDWSIGSFLQSPSTIDVHQYPLAHSLVAFLDGRGEDRLATMIRRLKESATIERALSDAFEGWTLERLEQEWKDAVRRSDPFFTAGKAASHPIGE